MSTKTMESDYVGDFAAESRTVAVVAAAVGSLAVVVAGRWYPYRDQNRSH